MIRIWAKKKMPLGKGNYGIKKPSNNETDVLVLCTYITKLLSSYKANITSRLSVYLNSKPKTTRLSMYEFFNPVSETTETENSVMKLVVDIEEEIKEPEVSTAEYNQKVFSSLKNLIETFLETHKKTNDRALKGRMTTISRVIQNYEKVLQREQTRYHKINLINELLNGNKTASDISEDSWEEVPVFYDDSDAEEDYNEEYTLFKKNGL